MIRQIAFSLFILAAAAWTAPAQEPSPTGAASARRQLAEETFQQLVDLSPLLDQLNLAVDLSSGEHAIDGHPDLWAPLLENIFFDYCNISDSLKTIENLRARNFDKVKRYTRHTHQEWDELGRRYAERRAAMEDLRNPIPSPLHLLSDPLTTFAPRLVFENLPQPRRDLQPRPSNPQDPQSPAEPAPKPRKRSWWWRLWHWA